MKTKEVEELRAQVEKTGSETQVELQKKTEEVIGLASKVSQLEGAIAELKKDTQSQKSSLGERDQGRSSMHFEISL